MWTPLDAKRYFSVPSRIITSPVWTSMQFHFTPYHILTLYSEHFFPVLMVLTVERFHCNSKNLVKYPFFYWFRRRVPVFLVIPFEFCFGSCDLYHSMENLTTILSFGPAHLWSLVSKSTRFFRLLSKMTKRRNLCRLLEHPALKRKM
jgi:hypothetical protein